MGVETRGFIFGTLMADAIGIPFVPCRKAGKLPGSVERVSYGLEYGAATLEMQKVPELAGKRAIVVDDVLATGGTLAAAIRLSVSSGLDVVYTVVFAELAFVKRTVPIPVPVHTLVRLE